MEIGDRREKFCEDCEAVTEQRLDKLVVSGSGEPVAQEWHCLDGDHTYGMRPKGQPPLEEPSA